MTWLKVTLFLVLSAAAVLLYLFLLSVFRSKVGPFSAAIPAFVLAVIAFAINWRFLKSEGRSLAELGFNAPQLRIVQAAAGFLAGHLIVGSWLLVLRAVAGMSWRRELGFTAAGALGSFLFAVFNNGAEELVYRGYLFRLLTRSYGAAVAIVATSTLFTLLHIQAGVPWQNAIAVVFTSAIFYSAVFLRWQSVPLTLAVHVGMNLMQEFAGLRASGLSLFSTSVASNGTRQAVVLMLLGLINLVLAAGVLFTRRSARS